ncbi:MAG: Asp-tRNA(Asn)/Glu-tRNA(Gln) amidotransferase subunit GatA [bacterium]|nr:Asp-tRNA(Asn)/Glu-tRNA(Gln) amidotransferase subunit GatA [bacterium]
MSNLTKLSAVEMREGILKKDFSAVELTRHHLERANSLNAKLNSFITICEKDALAQAEATDALVAKGNAAMPPLLGVPVSIKDMLVTEGIETTCASKILKGFIPPYECTAVRKLREAGAIIIGKTNLDEFAMGSSTENSAYGPTKNPWDESRVPGGSSGGSAVSVAAGQSAISLGTDTGGSIRQPASFTGVIGIKPTYGRVSRYGAVAYASSLDQIGPFARTIEDTALALQTISGKDHQDSTSLAEKVPNFLKDLRACKGNGLKDIRIGVPKEYFIKGVDAEIETAIRSAVKALESLGARIVEISLPHTEYALAAYYIIAPAEASSNLSRYDGVRYGLRSGNGQDLSQMYEHTRSEGFGTEVRRRILTGTYVLSAGYYDAYYRKAQQVRTLIINDFRKAFADACDVILTPVAPTTAFKIGENVSNPLQMYLGDIFSITANLAGLPGISVPCGLTKDNLPTSFQLLGAPLEEGLLLRVAQEYLDANPFNTTQFAG